MTACSTACCWPSMALALCATCSASALSDPRRSSVLWLSSCSWASGPSFLSTSLIVVIAAVVSSREAREDTTAAMTTIKDVERKLGPLAQLHELSQSTEERLGSLNALAEHVAHKAKAIEGQQQAVEHAVIQANRVNEMVW